MTASASGAQGRADFAMLLGSVFLLVVGAGPLSFDARIIRTVERTTG